MPQDATVVSEADIGPLREAVRLDPANAAAHRRLGLALQQLGRFGEAIDCFRRALVLQPRQTASYPDLVYSKKVADADRPLIAEMEALLTTDGLTTQDRANLHFALGKAYDDLAAYNQAIVHFDHANRFRRDNQPFNRQRHETLVSWLIERFTADFVARHAAFGLESELPIIILGMPRSGTTLVERILSSHPKVGAGGELTFWAGAAASFVTQGGAGFDRSWARAVGIDYRKLLQRISPRALRVTDKMPDNFFRAGLIRSIFPRARIIHCRRNPVDTCLSIYFTQFTANLDYAYDRGDIVSYYRQYERLMKHWRAVLPTNGMLDIDYEHLVADQEAVTRRLIAFCGLGWSEACLNPERNRDAVRTASMWQARQPIYRSSVERWRNYDPWLGEFRALLPEPAP